MITFQSWEARNGPEEVGRRLVVYGMTAALNMIVVCVRLRYLIANGVHDDMHVRMWMKWIDEIRRIWMLSFDTSKLLRVPLFEELLYVCMLESSIGHDIKIHMPLLAAVADSGLIASSSTAADGARSFFSAYTRQLDPYKLSGLVGKKR